MFPVEYR